MGALMRAELLAAAVLGALLRPATCWVTLPANDNDVEKKINWPLPEDPLDDTGLGGGLAFAIDPGMCDALLPVFKEDSGAQVQAFRFVTCEEINDAIARAMTTWSLNHPYITFYNVTDECIADNKGSKCSLAELYIYAGAPDSSSSDVAAFVLHNPEDIGRDYGSDTWRQGVRLPSGEVVEDDWEIQFTTLTFHNHICWYLDDSFCAGFRTLNEQLDVTLLMQFVLWGVWAMSLLMLFLRTAQVFFYVFRFGAKVGLRRAVQAQARDMLAAYVLLFCLIAPPIIWFQIFVPCLTCYDFEATAAHEIGHVLGFTHTDSFPELHRVAKEPFDDDNCAWAKSVPGKSGATVEFDKNDPAINESIMFHLTTKKSKTCLTENDLQGLLYQYPVCDDDLIVKTEPFCVKQPRNIGWVRFITAVVPPFVFASFAVFVLVQVALYYENREQTKNRWKLGGIAAVQKVRTAKATEEERRFAASIFGNTIQRAAASLSQGGSKSGSRAGSRVGSRRGSVGNTDAAAPGGAEADAEEGTNVHAAT